MDNNKITEFPGDKMGHVYEDKECAGCHEPIPEGKKHEYAGRILPFDTYYKHIYLCKKCDEISRSYGI